MVLLGYQLFLYRRMYIALCLAFKSQLGQWLSWHIRIKLAHLGVWPFHCFTFNLASGTEFVETFNAILWRLAKLVTLLVRQLWVSFFFNRASQQHLLDPVSKLPTSARLILLRNSSRSCHVFVLWKSQRTQHRLAALYLCTGRCPSSFEIVHTKLCFNDADSCLGQSASIFFSASPKLANEPWTKESLTWTETES